WDKTIKLWKVKTGRLIRTLEGHTGWVYSIVFGPDGKYLASGSRDGTVKLWDSVRGELIITIVATKEGEYVVYTPDGYYDWSPKGHNLVSVRLNNKLVPYDEEYKYKQKFHRPDIIQQRLSGKK
ncbi:MAG: hypothetical protein NZ839_00380, partial [Endomicrobia bacterium]|nr:hypothetical protein [Endomicrobiia bacterium]